MKIITPLSQHIGVACKYTLLFNHDKTFFTIYNHKFSGKHISAFSYILPQNFH